MRLTGKNKQTLLLVTHNKSVLVIIIIPAVVRLGLVCGGFEAPSLTPSEPESEGGASDARGWLGEGWRVRFSPPPFSLAG